jgi:hypothetical protein
MGNQRQFKVAVEKEFVVTLDMNKYNPEVLKQITEYWGYDYRELEDEEIIKESVGDIAHQYLNDGYLDKDLEGFPMNGQRVSKINTYVNIEEIKSK